MECIGCQLANGDLTRYMIYENSYLCCILDHDPYNEGHVLIIPKQHVVDVDECDEDTATEIMKASIIISKAIKLIYQPDGITICQNGGVFNELAHYHLHIVPRYKNQSFAAFYNSKPLNNQKTKDKLYETKQTLIEAVIEVQKE